MDPIGGVARTSTLEAVVAAWGDAAAGAEGVVDGAPNAGAVQAPGSAADHTVEAATLQALTRPQAQAVDPLRPADVTLPSPAHPGSAFLLPGDQLIPIGLVGLQVDAGALWALQRRAPEGTRIEVADDEPGRRHDDEPAEQDDEAPVPASAADDERARLDPVVEEVADDELPSWADALTRGLREALTLPVPPAALVAAMTQWLRGRCVVLACPQGADPAGPAWAFVLWPRQQRPLAWRGMRTAARLQWAQPPVVPRWCQAQAMKEHHPRRGRQLVAGGSLPECDVQLGPVLARPARPADVHLRIDTVRPFWAALGGQWSVTIVVCSRPLLPAEPPGAATC